jgi:hypothetical protein
MPRKRDRLHVVSDEVVARLYCQELLTYQEIGDRFGVTRQAVASRIKAMGITYRGEPVDAVCLGCGQTYKAQRKRIKRRQTRYCSKRCYHEATSIHGQHSKAGQREARKVAGAQEGETIHHVDGNTRNNHPSNLLIFKNNAAHMSFHKSGAARLLKEKVEAGEIVLSLKPRERIV